jgi:hypothetical protein
MGIITSIHEKNKHALQIENLQRKLIQQKNLTSKYLEELSRQKLIIHKHVLHAMQYEKEIKQYRIKVAKLNKYESTIQDSDELASHILSTELNCRWMNDEYEKKYLISVFDYITIAMSDPSFKLQQTNTPNHKALELKKSLKPMNIDQIYDKIDQIAMYSDALLS